MLGAASGERDSQLRRYKRAAWKTWAGDACRARAQRPRARVRRLEFIGVDIRQAKIGASLDVPSSLLVDRLRRWRALREDAHRH